MLNECAADLDSCVEEERERARWESLSANGLLNGACCDLAGAGMGGVGFDDDGISGGECGGGVSASDGEREREVAGSEDDDGTDGAEHRTNVGAREWFAFGEGFVNAGVDPRAFF